MSQPPSLRAIINDPEEGNAHIRATQSNEVRRHLEDTDSERTASASRESEHTTEAVTEHTSQPASEPSTPPSTIPNDRRTLIHPIGEKAFEPHSAHRRIIECIQKAYPQAIKSFKAAPQYLKDVWFNEFKKDYRWDPLEENIVRRIFEKKGAKLLTDHLREVRVRLADKSKAKPHWIADDVLDDLVRIWKSEDFKKVSEKNKSNRNSNSGGLGASLHSCGSIPMTEHHRRLKEKLGKDPSLADLYQHTHKRKNGDGAYVCAKAQKVLDTMNELRQTQTEASDVELWLEATGGVKRGGYVYGFGSDTQHYFPEASKKSKSQAGASSSNAALMAEIQEMREENKMFREENKFIREELSKMGAIFAQFSANPEFLSSLNLNNFGSQNDETQAHSDEDED
nr:putative transposase En/Spm [Ipomoea batatas]